MTPLDEGRGLLAQTASPSVLVALSGGKDSLVTLDMCCRHFPRVEAYLMELVEDLRLVRAPVEAAAKRHSIKVHYVPHWGLSGLLRTCVYRPYVDGAETVKQLSQKDVEAYLREKTGIDWFAYGERCADSLTRNAKLKRFKGIDHVRRRVYPVYMFKTAGIYGYLKARKIPVPAMQGSDGTTLSGGVTLDAECMMWLKRVAPDDYAKVVKKFPLIPGVIFRREQMGIDPLREVRDAAKWKARKAREDAKVVEARDGKEDSEGDAGAPAAAPAAPERAQSGKARQGAESARA